MLKLGICPEGGPDDPSHFIELFPKWQNISKDGIEGCDAVIFWGGTDIHPELYGAKRNYMSQAPMLGPSRRDVFEMKAMQWCRVNNIPMIGVCRGAQLMCAFAGGSLAQHVTGHRVNHMISTLNDGDMMATSEHHQMMNISGTDGVLLAWSKERRSTMYQGEDSKDILSMREAPEAEIVYFPSIKGLAIQGHPEWCSDPLEPFVQLCNKYVIQYLFGE
jgi:hypothetical protein